MAFGTTTRVGSYGGFEPGQPVFCDVLTFLGDAAYVAGAGGTLLAATTPPLNAAGMEGKTIVSIQHQFSSNLRYELRHNPVTGRLQIFDVQTNAEAVNGDYSGTTFHALVWSR